MRREMLNGGLLNTKMKSKIKNAIKEALINKDKLRLETLRGVLSAFEYKEMADNVSELNEETGIAILKTELKKRKEELDFAEQANREEYVASLLEEIKIVEEFLPIQLNKDQLTTIIKSIAEQEESASMGSVMKVLKSQYAGQYDGKMASELARELLA